MERNLSRSYDGKTIHRRDCRGARLPWNWADTATDDELLRAKLIVGLKVCKVCEPDFRSPVVSSSQETERRRNE